MRFSDAGRLLQSVEFRLETIRRNWRLSSPVATCEGDAKAMCKVDLQGDLQKYQWLSVSCTMCRTARQQARDLASANLGSEHRPYRRSQQGRQERLNNPAALYKAGQPLTLFWKHPSRGSSAEYHAA